MKKLLWLILMFGVSLPILAKEMKLSCKYNDEYGVQTTFIHFIDN